MIIDSHTHLGRNEHIKANVKELLDSMDKAHIDKSLVFAGELNNLSTKDMLEEIRPHRDRLHGVASWDFEYPINNPQAFLRGPNQQDLLADMYEAGEIVAVKFYTGYYHYMPNEMWHVLSKLNKVGCPAIFHCGDCLNSVRCAKLKYAHPLNIDEVAVDYPNMNFIIAHMGYPWVRDAAEVCYKNSNVFADISGFVYGNFTGPDQAKFMQALQEFSAIAPSDKLLFGTDWPISNQDSYIDAMEWIVTSTHKDSVIYTPQHMTLNTIRAFGIPL